MNYLADHYGWLEAPQVSQMDTGNTLLGSQSSLQAYVSLKNEVDKVIVYERAGLLFVFNFHPTESFTDYRVGVDDAGKYGIVLSSDERKFGGFDNIALNSEFFTTPMEWNGRKNWIQVCFCARSSIITSLTFSSRYIYRLGRVLYWQNATDRPRYDQTTGPFFHSPKKKSCIETSAYFFCILCRVLSIETCCMKSL